MRTAGFAALCAVFVLTVAGACNPSGQAKAILGATRTQISARDDLRRMLREARLACSGQTDAAVVG